MSANRRSFFHLLLSLPVVGNALGWLSPGRRPPPSHATFTRNSAYGR